MRTSLYLVAFVATLLSACGPASTRVGPVPSTSVAGKVLSAYREPVADVQVIITGQRPVKTDSGGNFRVSTETVPFDLILIHGERQPVVYVYKGLRRVDPVLFLRQLPTSTPWSTIAGSLSGPSIPQPPGYHSLVAFSSPEVESHAATEAERTGDFVIESLYWMGLAPTQGTVHALQWRIDGGGRPVEYSYGSRRDVILNPPVFDGETWDWSGPRVTIPSIALAATGTSRISGSFDVSSGYDLVRTSWYLKFDSDALLESFLSADSSSQASFDHEVPDVQSIRFVANVVATDRVNHGQVSYYKSEIFPGQTGLNIAVPSINPEPIASPVDASSDVGLNTDFRWSPVASTVSILTLRPESPNAFDAPWYFIFTSENTASIPDLAQFGISLSRSARYSWQVQVDPSSPDMDTAMGAHGLVERNPWFSQPHKYTTDIAQGFSQVRNFSTAP